MAPPLDVTLGPNVLERVSAQQGREPMERTIRSGSVSQEQERTKEKGRTSVQELQMAVDDMNRKAQDLRRSVQFSVDRELNMTVVKVVDSRTEEVVRQIPSEEFIEISKALRESRSLIFDAEA